MRISGHGCVHTSLSGTLNGAAKLSFLCVLLPHESVDGNVIRRETDAPMILLCTAEFVAAVSFTRISSATRYFPPKEGISVLKQSSPFRIPDHLDEDRGSLSAYWMSRLYCAGGSTKCGVCACVKIGDCSTYVAMTAAEMTNTPITSGNGINPF